MEWMASTQIRRVLVVEDNEDNRKILVYRLRRLRNHFEDLIIDEAADGMEAVASAAANTPDLIIMDINMPVMDGFEAARVIRSLEGPAAHVPILALTAESLSLDDSRCAQTGVSDYLQKPIVDPETLQTKVLFWIERKHLTQTTTATAL